MYFRLNPECYFIEGEHKGAIYDLIEGDIYSLTPEESQIIKKCEDNGIIDEDEEFLSNIKNNCLGNFYDEKVYIEKLRVGSPIEEYQPGRPPSLTRAFLEINNTCESNCWYCGNNGINRSSGCVGCNVWNENGRELSIERWKKILDELYDLDCSIIYLSGGDLTLIWDKTKAILDYANGRFKNIYIILKNESFTDNIKEEIKDIAIPIIQTEDPADIKGEYLYHLIIEQDDIDNLPDIPYDVALEVVSKNFKVLKPTSPLTSKTKIPKTDVYTFSRNKKIHSCLGNSLTITWKGDVLPCPMMRKHVLGNICDAGLYTVFQENKEGIEKFWNLCLDTVQRCKSCEFKYACNECRALEESLTENLKGKYLCNYEPSTGIWL